ncbi:MAG: ribbon-helix-helix protein, CopG family [Calditrichaceae bacterium]|nr:ribbon-helix-helix protein, CopG family [Calditrichia bacterium]NUQ43052.1 ribbon-helix-helix protein, CopG family [Calditrichaceae bacterium]
MKNIKITLSDQLVAEIDKLSDPLGVDFSRIVEEALQAWLRRHYSKRFGEEWIAALKKYPDDAGRAEAWFESQYWSEQ